MPKFRSFDGIDKNGVRAEVTVQTGRGTIRDIVGRGKQAEDGSYRNMEIVFDPDNPLLKQKVYGLLDTSATELWNYIQQAKEDGRTITYRIESQRRNGVDRTLPISELNPPEQIRRILAGIDGIYSHEAKTNPAEDPPSENPSALTQNLTTAPAASAGQAAASPDALVAALRDAVTSAALPLGVMEALAAQALAAGVPATVVAEHMARLSEGVSLDSEQVARAAEAEQFALDHLIEVYTPAKSKESVAVSDEMLAQAASVAIALLGIADEVQAKFAALPHANRANPSYARALRLVIDAVDKRHAVPVGGNEQSQSEWRQAVTEEALERLYGLTQIAQGKVPLSEAERGMGEPDSARERADAEPPVPAVPPTKAAPEKASEADILNDMSLLKSSHDITVFTPAAAPAEDEPGFQMPEAGNIARLRALCENANVTEDTKAISDWIERRLGVRTARKVHAPVLEAFCTHYEQAGPDQVRLEVLEGI